MIHFSILTLFPEFFDSVLSTSMLRKGQERGALRFDLIDIRDFAPGKHRMTDDTPYGGGAGMVMKPEPIVGALESLPPGRRVFLSPRGTRFDQRQAERLAALEHVALLCGRYEGVDERVLPYVDEEISVGDFILSGGEIAATVVVDAVSRLVDGVLGAPESAEDESFAEGLLEYPHYTRPAEFRGAGVPPVLTSGDHAAIARWRRHESLRRTRQFRPELLSKAELSDEDRDFLASLDEEGEGGDD